MKRAFLLITLMVPMHSYAGEIVFSCSTQSGKRITVMKDGDKAHYLFYGTRKNVELSITNKIPSMDISLSEPQGSTITTSIPFKNGPFVYDVFTSIDRLTDEHPSHSGVIVSKNNEFLTQVKCKSDTVEGNLLDIE